MLALQSVDLPSSLFLEGFGDLLADHSGDLNFDFLHGSRDQLLFLFHRGSFGSVIWHLRQIVFWLFGIGSRCSDSFV